MKRIYWLMCLGILFTGCATMDEPYGTSFNDVTGMVGTDKAPQYIVGVQQGCDSGFFTGGDSRYKFNKDYPRSLEDAQYQDGWDEGFGRCIDYARAQQYRPWKYSQPMFLHPNQTDQNNGIHYGKGYRWGYTTHFRHQHF